MFPEIVERMTRMLTASTPLTLEVKSGTRVVDLIVAGFFVLDDFLFTEFVSAR